MKSPIYVIHDPRRTDRAKLLHQELEAQGLNVDDIHMMPAVYRENPADGIAEAHKACVRHCMGTNEPFAIIMEDRFGNHYQANFITRHNYADQVKKTFSRLMPLDIPRAVDLGKLFTTA